MLEKFPDRLFLLHIPKTGGTTLHEMLQDYFLPSEVCPERYSSIVHMAPLQLEKYKFFSAHAPYDLIYKLRPPARIVSMFREPIQRSISGYHYLRRVPKDIADQPGFEEAKLAQSHSLVEFLSGNNDLVQELHSNQQFSILCGHRYLNPEGLPWRGESEILDVGYMRIESMDCFGITEYMPASIEAIWRTLGLRRPAQLLHLNSGMADDLEDKTLGSVYEKLEKMNQLDLKLYAFAKEKFLSDPLNRTFSLQGFSSEFPRDMSSPDQEPRYIANSGKSGYCLFGPYVQLGAGNYTCTFKVSFRPSGEILSTEVIANVDVFANRPNGIPLVFASKNLSTDQMYDGRMIDVSLPFTLEKGQSMLEFRLFFEGRGTLIALAKVSISINH